MESTKQTKIDISAPAFYNNRELSWLAFNERVLEEALDVRNPLAERMKFLAIFSSNLDEFFMVRVAGLMDQVKAGFNRPENKAGLTPKEQLEQISVKTHKLIERQSKLLNEEILTKLRNEQIELISIDQMTENQLRFIEHMFDDTIFPVLTPLAVDAYRPFPMLLNKSLNLAVLLQDEAEEGKDGLRLAIVQVPAVLDRTIDCSLNGTRKQFVMLEDIITHFLYKLFKGYEVLSVSEFRITRNADLTIHEEGARDLLKEIEKELKKRKWGAAVRLEVKKNAMNQQVLSFLLAELEIGEQDVYEISGPLDLTFLFTFYKKIARLREDLIFQTLIPQPPGDLLDEADMFEAMLKQDIFLHHPYESFEPVVDFLAKAADDPHVLAIKQTLYRVSGDSPIIESLKRAAENGKSVMVLVELKARFDEEKNVQWAKELEMSGCHVIYGMTYLKTHSKITLIVRQRDKKIERFVHLGTGNYNDITAKLYTDMGLLTCNRKIGIDATNFFNYLSGYTEKPDFHHLSVAPFDIRNDLITLIDQEIALQKKNKDGKIIAKMNSLTDKRLIMKLYEASQAGVQIDLIVRGICCLRPKIKGVSDNIRVRSIVGRFLEHSRIYYFHHSGEEKIYLSSADLMTRNMEKRVEIMFPIFDGRMKQGIKKILHISLMDNVKAREQDQEGNYHYVKREPGEEEIDSQMLFFLHAYRVAEDEE